MTGTATIPDEFDVVVVGAGYTGAVVAERLATDSGVRVLVLDRRPHIAGNAYDAFDEHGVLVHHYGPHIFHTNSDKVFEYLSRFTAWRPYEHRVLAVVREQLLPMPINRTTINRLYGLELSSEPEAEAFFAARREDVPFQRTSEDTVVGKVGRELYELFFRGYTRKHWGLDPRDLHASVTARIPVRTNTDDRYFTDVHQQLPRDGYTRMFERMLDHPRITVRVGVEFDDVRDRIGDALLVYTGPIDAYFSGQLGPLPYRSLHFETRSVPTPAGEFFQPVAQVNFPSEDVPYTRITEYRHFHGQTGLPMTTLHYEYPRAQGDPYYPVPRDENRELYKRYRRLADETAPNVVFAGRLGSYQYLNMDQATAQALAVVDRLVGAGRVPATGRLR